MACKSRQDSWGIILHVYSIRAHTLKYYVFVCVLQKIRERISGMDDYKGKFTLHNLFLWEIKFLWKR